jgi:hypothetical protein
LPSKKTSGEERRFDLSKLRMRPIREREHLVRAERFARLPDAIPGFGGFVESLPDVYAGADWKTFVRRIVEARRGGRPVVLALGAHVVKCGLSPVILDLMRRRIVTALALNGAGAIHDLEVAAIGETSEDVAKTLLDGTFGLVRETPELMNRAAARACREKIGFGCALGEIVREEKLARRDLSLLAAGVELDVPVTVHVCIGADTVHLHPGTDGAALGEATLRDFRRICEIVAGLDGGVWANVGCAVVLPEVFLKAVSAALNLGYRLDGILTVDLDMIRHYRPMTNVVQRPPGRGISIVGQHEILLPLLRQSLLAHLERA